MWFVNGEKQKCHSQEMGGGKPSRLLDKTLSMMAVSPNAMLLHPNNTDWSGR